MWGSLATRTAHRLKAMGRRIPEVNLRTLNQQNQGSPEHLRNPNKKQKPPQQGIRGRSVLDYTKGAHRA